MIKNRNDIFDSDGSQWSKMSQTDNNNNANNND